jgi:hypothetical protein
VLADDTLAAARHAAEHGWIAERALAEIGGDARDDAGATPVKAPAPGVEQPAPGPAPVVVERAGDLP